MGILGIIKKNLGMVEQILGLHYRSLKVMKLVVELHYRCPSSNQEESLDSEASDGV